MGIGRSVRSSHNAGTWQALNSPATCGLIAAPPLDPDGRRPTESFYTQAISSGSAVVSFNALPIANPASATFS
jgi:hypothetical protein